jgi:hypothetical protein
LWAVRGVEAPGREAQKGSIMSKSLRIEKNHYSKNSWVIVDEWGMTLVEVAKFESGWQCPGTWFSDRVFASKELAIKFVCEFFVSRLKREREIDLYSVGLWQAICPVF